MKTTLLSRLTWACVFAIAMVGINTARAGETPDPGAVTVDVFVVRPACFVATVLGSAIFVVSLPVAATSKSVRRSARALVTRPADATFTRRLGDLDSLSEY